MLGTTWGAWEKTFEVNLKGPFALTQAVSQRLIGAGKPGNIINMSSILGQQASLGQGVYGMTKAALISMTKTLGMELGAAGIRVNAIAPGVVKTRLAAALTEDPKISAVITGRTALGRVAEPHEISGIAVFLASDEASYVTGQTFFIDGGYTIG
jgi:NAD(P)-dependent dehydrogenase (short-subunit alcohol dehydrogenase family)